MAKATVASLSERERLLIAETERDQLRSMDEDGLIELHGRVRRARDRVVQLHRREVAAEVATRRARGKVSQVPRRSAGKAEIFEDALARVSTALASAARASARELRDERIAAARRDKHPAPVKPNRRDTPPVDAERTATKTPRQRTAVAAQRAEGARVVAKRDQRQ